MKMILRGPAGEAKRMERETGVETVAAQDGMELLLDDRVTVRGRGVGKREQRSLNGFVRK
jgi:hypothetical protein